MSAAQLPALSLGVAFSTLTFGLGVAGAAPASAATIADGQTVLPGQGLLDSPLWFLPKC